MIGYIRKDFESDTDMYNYYITEYFEPLELGDSDDLYVLLTKDEIIKYLNKYKDSIIFGILDEKILLNRFCKYNNDDNYCKVNIRRFGSDLEGINMFEDLGKVSYTLIFQTNATEFQSEQTFSLDLENDIQDLDSTIEDLKRAIFLDDVIYKKYKRSLILEQMGVWK